MGEPIYVKYVSVGLQKIREWQSRIPKYVTFMRYLKLLNICKPHKNALSKSKTHLKQSKIKQPSWAGCRGREPTAASPHPNPGAGGALPHCSLSLRTHSHSLSSKPLMSIQRTADYLDQNHTTNNWWCENSNPVSNSRAGAQLIQYFNLP